jgi:outer membrane murein-binding lipoprotein Lpp
MKTSVKYLMVIFLAVLTAALAGCSGISQKQYDELQSQLAQAQNDRDAAKSQVSSVQKELDNANDELSSLQSQYNTVQSQLNATQDEMVELKNDMESQADAIAEKQAEVSQLQAQLDTILNTSLMQYYRVTYQNRNYAWDLPVTLRSYFDFKAKIRRPRNLPAMVLEDDPALDTLVTYIKDSSLENNLKKSETVNLVARLIQGLPRTNHDEKTPYDDYPRYPVETLVEQATDSQDAAILAAAILYRLEYQVVFFYWENPEHYAVGVYLPSTGGYNWEYGGKSYYVLETTGIKWELGDAPPSYRSAPVITPLIEE